MNIPRYEFSKENTNYLLEFLKTAKEMKSSSFCNLNEYANLKKILPLEDETKELLKNYIKTTNSLIDLTVDNENHADTDNEIQASCFPYSQNENLKTPVEETGIDDMIYAIKESLDNDKCLPPNVISQLNNLENLEALFISLSQELNFEAVSDFGKTLITSTIHNNSIIGFYVKYLLLQKVNVEFTEELGNIFNQLAFKFPEVLKDEICKYLLSHNIDYSKVLLQVLNHLNADFKSNLLKMFVFQCPQFQGNYISLVEILLTSQTDVETFSKLLEIISPLSNFYNTNKSFGKLLLNIVIHLKSNIQIVEPLLTPIITSHNSIWKSKIQKNIDDYQQESQLFTQSFRS